MSSNTLYSSAYPAYPAVKTVNCDIIAADGSICTGCRIGNGKIVPIYAEKPSVFNYTPAYAAVKRLFAARATAEVYAFSVADGVQLFARVAVSGTGK